MREDRRFALVATVIANSHRDPSHEPFDISEFMPEYEAKPKDKRQSDEDMLEVVKIANEMLGGKVT